MALVFPVPDIVFLSPKAEKQMETQGFPQKHREQVMDLCLNLVLLLKFTVFPSQLATQLQDVLLALE